MVLSHELLRKMICHYSAMKEVSTTAMVLNIEEESLTQSCGERIVGAS